MSMYAGDVQILQTLTTHTSDVNAVDFAGESILVTGSGDKRVRVWEWQPGAGFTEASFSPLLGHKYGVTSVKVSPQLTMLASASIDGTTQLWNLRSGTKIHTMVQAGGEAVRICRFSPDSSLLVTAGDNGQVCLWDLVRRTLIRCFQKHEGAIQSLSFTPDSNWLLTSCTLGVLQLFCCNEIIESCPSREQDLTVFAQVDDAHDLGVVCCDFSSTQEITSNEPFARLYQLVTCGNDSRVKLWEVKVTQDKCDTQPITASIELCRIMEKHSSALTCVRFSSNGLYTASSGLDKTVVLWETNTGRVIAVLTGHNRYVACCAFSKNGNLLATGSNDKRVIVWDLTGNLSLDSELVRHSSVKLQNNEKPEKTLIQETEVVKHAETSGNDVKLIQRLDDHNGAVNSVAMFGNRLIASGSGDKLVRVWCVKYDEDGESTSIFQEMNYNPLDGHKYSVNYVEFSPCGTKLASCSMDGTTVIWDVENGSQARTSFVNSGTAVRVCRWSPDGTKIATAGDDEKTILWDLETMAELSDSYSVYEGHADAITAIAFSPDSRYLVTACSEGAWRLFDTRNTESSEALLVCDVGHDLGVQGCDFSPTTGPFTMTGSRDASSGCAKECYMLATCGNDSLIKLWKIIIMEEDLDLEESTGSSDAGISYRERRQFAGHGGNVMCVKFSPVHGEILGSVATDRTARLWSVHTGMCLHVLESHESLVTTCAFSEDTSLFLTGALDKTVLIWKLPDQLVSQSILIDRLRNNKKKIVDWAVDDVSKWLVEVELGDLVRSVQALSISGRMLLRIPDEVIIAKLQFNHDHEALEMLRKQLYWLKREDCNAQIIAEDTEIPDDFLCPITHEIMREPVQCSDGFTYERAAINEWFLCGKFTSPMTNEPLKTTSLTPNVALRNAIFTLLHGEGPSA
ncbi:WD repeat, SAM and U-box domain-containing protein 1 isoform X1 [Nasonia vitripennis]|uniref:U-box domain-containing protein n=1 Tax=Nasonia vitripennis TaxID=7425 RepID=A0A7M7QJU5_NASVI|nr:WD repeat, SAM and U-box domain-containing protein 1 isoform X1 [Nasonia vitripennis]XP_032457023.1 WD repeat, SAM and U-box domain-containing protein 1 isoform X1 [Nasonia vitripennis]